MTTTERLYLEARVKHSITAQECWRLRAALDREGFTYAQERELDKAFASEMWQRTHPGEGLESHG